MDTYRFAKSPGSALDYNLDLTRWLSDDKNVLFDGIASVTVTTDPSDLAVGAITHSNTVASVMVSGGANLTSYTLTWTITTTGGRLLVRHVSLSVEG